MRRVGVVGAVVALAILAATVSLLPLETPQFTRALSQRFSLDAEAGFSQPRMGELAEKVRAFVVDGRGELPAVVEGRAGFDSASVAHLVDVRRVLSGARLASGLLAGALFLWVAASVFGRDTRALAAALRAASWAAVALVAMGILIAAIDFEAFFSAFHSLFFASGSWLFPSDSLLIQTFPEKFWVWSGVSWGLVTLTVAFSYRILAVLLVRAEEHRAQGADAV